MNRITLLVLFVLAGACAARGAPPQNASSKPTDQDPSVEAGPLEVTHRVSVPEDVEPPPSSEQGNPIFEQGNYQPTVYQLEVRRKKRGQQAQQRAEAEASAEDSAEAE